MPANPHASRVAAAALAAAGACALLWSERAGLVALASFAPWETAQATAVAWRLGGAALLGVAAAKAVPIPRLARQVPELMCAACVLMLCPVLWEASIVVRQLCLGTFYPSEAALLDGRLAPMITGACVGGGLWGARALKRFRPPLVAVAALALGAWTLWCTHENVFLPYRGVFYSIPAVAGAAFSVTATVLIVAAAMIAARATRRLP